MPVYLRTLCLVTLVLCNVHDSLEHEIPRRSFLSRRAIDGTRGRKYFDPEEEGAFDSYGSAGGQYDPYEEKTDLSDIRRNVPGEPGVDYPAYTTLPQTGFTCEGRSRGYYADEVAGCQVFHVCHDVLVSSFLCPIGSIFSQKLLTCDWWTKVDCSSSGKYIDVNRNSYQQDDDEMIRNAYAMISLQSGTDVTKDGLVDPDRTGSIIDYQRTRIPDYSSLDPTGNDLRSNFDDYPNPVSRNFLPPYQPKERKIESSRSYQERFYPNEKSRSPYEDSPIIRVQTIKDHGFRDQDRNKDFQDPYHRSNEFTNRFQPSYAPTVPTVTTTTRRFYSPTVPTTFKPSTIAYNKLDQVLDSSDYYFSRRTKDLVTPPTRIFDNHRGSHDVRPVTSKTVTVPPKVDDYNDSYEDYEDANSDEGRHVPSREKFQVRVFDDYRLNRTGDLFDQIYRGLERIEEDEGLDIETRSSIGLGQALSQSLRRISVPQQNPVSEDVRYRSNPEKKEESHEQYQRNDQRNKERTLNQENREYVPSTTPSVIESTIKATTNLQELSSTVLFNSKTNITEDGDRSLKRKDPLDRIDEAFQNFEPTESLKPLEPPKSKFQINVPDLSEVSTLVVKYSTVNDGIQSRTRTTEIPGFETTYPDGFDRTINYGEQVDVIRNHGNSRESQESSFSNYPRAEDKVPGTVSWLSSPAQSESKISFGSVPTGFSNFDRSLSSNHQSDSSVSNRTQFNHSPRFGIGDTLPDSKSICSDKSGNCEESTKTTLPINSPIILSTSNSPTDVVPSVETISSTKGVTTTLATKPQITEASGSTLKTTTHRSIESRKSSKEDTETSTASNLFRPETLKQIEESIEKNNSPYHVTLTVNKDEELIPSADDLISKLIAQQGKESSTFTDKLHELEIIRSIEPEVHSSELESSTATPVDSSTASSTINNRSIIEENDSNNRDFSMISLLQLMSELLKLDRVPRPFSLINDQDSVSRTRSEIASSSLGSKTLAKEVNFSMQLQEEVTETFEESSTESLIKTTIPKLKDRILDQLTENFGEPLFRNNKKSLEPPRKDRTLDFEINPLRNKDSNQETTSFRTTIETNSSKTLDRVSIVTSTVNGTTPVPQTTLTTDSGKTVVKTEFLPSIGFALDTDEGREEYVEAVLGGLIEPEAAESEKKETVLLDGDKKDDRKKNETLREV